MLSGLSDTVGQAAIDNSMEIAFGNREADRMVLGTDLTPSLILSEAGMGPISNAARMKNYNQYGYVQNPAITAPVGAAFGAAIGSKLGRPIMGGIKGRNSRCSYWWSNIILGSSLLCKKK